VGLNPQGSDQARALLTFADGKLIEAGDTRAEGWLMIHGANLFGHDKVGFDDRIKWVDENLDAIQRVALDPLANMWWTEADRLSAWPGPCTP
jgi:DNA-directed RNA polymerase